MGINFTNELLAKVEAAKLNFGRSVLVCAALHEFFKKDVVAQVKAQLDYLVYSNTVKNSAKEEIKALKKEGK
jgi:phosphoribosylpyrophosphate synthetase